MKNKIALLMKLTGIFFILLVFSCKKDTENTVSGAKNFIKTFDGVQHFDDWGNSVQQTTDGGYIVTGRINSQGFSEGEMGLIKFDASGNELWIKTFSGVKAAEGHSVQQTSDNGYIVAGTFAGSSGDFAKDARLIKTNSSGGETWSKFWYNNPTDSRQIAYSVDQTNDGGYIITGYYDSELWVKKTDASGNDLWDNTFSHGAAKGYCVQQTSDGGYIVSGENTSMDQSDVWLIKLNSSGNQDWKESFGSLLTGHDDVGYSVQQTSDGGFIIAGETLEVFPITKLWLIKTNKNGKKLWEKRFGDKETDDYVGYSIQQTSDDGFIITGQKRSQPDISEPPTYSVFLIKTEENGNKSWEKTFTGYKGNEVQQTSDGGFIITGQTGSRDEYDLLLIKTDQNGNVN
jgi:hypothetical protein